MDRPTLRIAVATLALGGGCAGSGGSEQISPTYEISGTVSGAVVAGVTVTLSGASTAAALTGATGGYSFAGLRDGSYQVTPSLGGCVFSPPSIAVTVAGANAEGENFVAAAIRSFTATGSMTTARYGHTATLLPSGVVLLAGGFGTSGVSVASAELYDPVAGTFTVTGSLLTPRDLYTATLLPSGKVLIAGGWEWFNATSGVPLNSAELYGLGGAAFTATGSMTTTRWGHTATLLPNGKVLIVGGVEYTSYSTASAELYDPSTGTFTATGSLLTARDHHTATVLPDGKVLIAGGQTSYGYPTLANVLLASAELYDPGTATFTSTGSMLTARAGHTATMLTGGKVLVAGGYGTNGDFPTSADLYDPVTGSFASTGSLAAARNLHTATLLPNGTVLVAGGYVYTSSVLALLGSAELYDSAAGTFTATGSLLTPREWHAATLLPSGKVLIAGGVGSFDANSYAPLSSAELY